MPGIKPIDLKGFGGPHGALVGRGLNKVRRAANRQLRRRFEAMFGAGGGPGGPAMHGDGNVEREFAKVARALSQSRVATLALGEAGYAESGMADLPGGDRTSEGALQLLSSTAAGLGVDPHDEGAVASLFFNRGFYGKGGANALAAQGLPAHLVAQGVQGSGTSDGSNYAAQEGRARGWMSRFGLQGGGVVPHLAGGGIAGIVSGAQDAYQSGTQFPVAQSRIGDWGRKVTKIRQNIDDWGHAYVNSSRRFDLSEEEFIDEGEVSDDGVIIRQPSLRQDQIAKRVGELNELIRQREKIVRAYENLIAYVTKIRDQYQRMMDRTKGSIKRLHGALDHLKGRPGKEAGRARERIQGWMSQLGDRLTGLRTNRDAQSRTIIDEGFNLESARLDLEDLGKELGPLLGGGAGLTVPDPFKQTQTADQSAIADQALAREAVALGELRSVKTALAAFAGPGDIGQGGPTAKGAVVNPTGVVGAGYSVGPGGVLMPVAGGTGASSGGGGVSAFGGGGGNTYIFPSSVPYTRDQAYEVSKMFGAGVEQQAPPMQKTTVVKL
jgi:hypothetical protein